MENSHKSDFLGSQKISKLLASQSMPAIFGMLTIAFYNVVDTIFIGRGVGTLGLAGVSVALPVLMTVMALSQTIGIGISSIISRALGAKDMAKAESALGNFFSSIVITGILLSILGYIFLSPLLRLFGAIDDIFPFAFEYTRVIIFGILPFAFISASNNIIRAEGNAKLAMITMFLGAAINLILDPILIFGMNMGVAGAAWATIIAWIISGAYVVYYFISGKSSIRFYLKNLKLKLHIIKETLMIGSSSFARQISVSVMAIIINVSLGNYGASVAIAAFGIINRMIMLVNMPMFGIVQGLQPIIGYNYGAKSYDRVREVIILGLKVSTTIASVAFLIIMLLARPIVMIFTKDQELIDISITASRIIVLFLPFLGFQLIASGVYQSMGRAMIAFWISLLKQVIFLIPLVIILPIFFGLSGVWWSFPVADVLTTVVVAFLLIREFKILKNKQVIAIG